MRNEALNPKVGLAFCDDNYHLVIVPERGVIRRHPGKVVSETRMHATISQILRNHINFTPSHVGISHHDPAVRTMIAQEFHILAFPPTIATLEGLDLTPSPARTVLRRGNGGQGTSGILKIGPKKVSYAKAGDRQPRSIDTDVIAGFSGLAAHFSNFVGQYSKDPVELLGNWGWVNAARFFEETEPALVPDPRTRKFLYMDTNVRQHRRDFVSHIGWMTAHGDPFCTRVSNFMIEQIGRTIGYVAQKAAFEKLYVQCNAISAVQPMVGWVKGPAGNKALTDAIAKHDSTGLSGRPDIILIEPQPWVPESLGAVKLASQLVGASR